MRPDLSDNGKALRGHLGHMVTDRWSFESSLSARLCDFDDRLGASGDGGKPPTMPGGPRLMTWRFDVQEASAGVHRATGTGEAGRTVETTGTDADDVLERCQSAAREMQVPDQQ